MPVKFILLFFLVINIKAATGQQKPLRGKITAFNLQANNTDTVKHTRISLRCKGTNFGGGMPLLVVDGALRDFSEMAEIKPDGIDSLLILPPSAATALYGANGINGAILIERKRKVLPVINIVGFTLRRTNLISCGIGGVRIYNGKIDPRKLPGVQDVFSIFPNPLPRGTDFYLTMINGSGKYAVRIFDLNGKVVFSRIVDLANGKESERIHCGENLPAGVLFIQLITPQGKKLPVQKLVVL